MKWLLVACALAACGDNHSNRNDAAIDTLSDVDAPPDAPTSAQLTVLARGAPITAWTFSDTPVGSNGAVTMFVRNDGSAANLSVGLWGSDYMIDAAGSSCDDVSSLAPGAYCHIRLTFAPSAAGAHDSMLTLASGSAPFALPLHGTALAPSAGLTLDASSVDFGLVYTSQSAPNATALLINNGVSTAALDSLVVAGAGFQLITHNCPATLTPGGACSITLGYNPAIAGASSGSLTVTSGATQLVVELSGFAARAFMITLAGGGTGTVTSMPDVQCGQACLDNALGTVVLTSTPDAGSLFAGWQSLCGTNTTCTFPPGGPVSITARFELVGAKAIAITVAGGGRGFVYVKSSTVITACTSSCTTYVPSGTAVDLFGYTPSTFNGWIGDCTTSSNDCNLGTVVNDRAATVTFAPDEREVTTLLLATPITGMAMTPDGDLVVADASGVSRITTTGAVVWSTPIAGGAKDLVTDAAGNVYARGGPGLFALTAGGVLRWTRAIAVVKNPLRSIQSTISVSPDGTVVAAHTSDGAAILDGTGADRFTVTGLTSDGMAVAPDGTVAIGTASATLPPSLDVRRFDKTGASLTTLVALPSDRDASLIYDTQNALCSQTTVGGYSHVSRIGSDLGTIFTNGESTGLATSPPAGVGVASTGDVVAMRGVTQGAQATGMRIEVFSPTGTSTWTHAKPANPVPFGAPIQVDGVTPLAISVDGNHQVAIAGTYSGMPWIQVYAMP